MLSQYIVHLMSLVTKTGVNELFTQNGHRGKCQNMQMLSQFIDGTSQIIRDLSTRESFNLWSSYPTI